MVAAPRVTRMFRRIQRHAGYRVSCECSRTGGGRAIAVGRLWLDFVTVLLRVRLITTRGR